MYQMKKSFLFLIVVLCAPCFSMAQAPNWSLLTPQLGGTLRFGFAIENQSKWFTDFSKIKHKITESEEIYTLTDPILGKGSLIFTIRKLKDSKGAVMQLSSNHLPENAKLIWCYGGASNNDVQDWVPQIMTEDCYQNVFSIEGNSFTLYYGTSRKLKILEALTPPGEKVRLADAQKQQNPAVMLTSGKKTTYQMAASEFDMVDGELYYFCFYFLNPKADYNYDMLPKLFQDRSYIVNKETNWMKSTPD